MNLAVRRARALEAMQAEYDAKARQWEELQAKKRELEAVRVRGQSWAGGGGWDQGPGGAGRGGSRGEREQEGEKRFEAWNAGLAG